jgi:hypothetical protein
MKFVRYGKAGAEKPGMIGPDGKIRDLSGTFPICREKRLRRRR